MLTQICQVRLENKIPESTWAAKREEIARELRDLGVGYSKILRDGWVSYLEDKHARSGAPIPRRANPASVQKRVLDDDSDA